MDYAVLAARHFARATALEGAIRKIMEAHRWNVARMSVTEVHAACFDALQPAVPLREVMDGPFNRTEPGKPIPMATSTPAPDYQTLAYDWEAAALYWMRQCDLWRELPRYSVVGGHEVADSSGPYIHHDQLVLEPAGEPMLTDYKAFHDQALAAANEAGYAGMSPADVIKAQFENIADLEASEKAMIEEVEPLLVDVKSALKSHDMGMTGLLARIDKVLK